MHIDNLIHPVGLARIVENGYVRAQDHPEMPYRILNYTEKTAYENAWNPPMLVCRGLIYNTDTGEVLARPFAKFFNWGQAGCAEIMLTAPVHVTDKLDGSLGIIYPTPDGYAVSTRGSFVSEQAQHATKTLHTKYPDFRPPPGMTVLVEIIYPTNRIVVDYGDTDDLILLGAVGITDGCVYDHTCIPGWNGPRATTFECPTLADALRFPPRPNAEGIVVRCLKTGGMVKIKQSDYVALHRIVTGLTARGVWHHLCEGKPLADLIEPLPDEFHSWVREVAGDIAATVSEREKAIRADFEQLREGLLDGWTRKDFARVAVPHPDKWAMFLLLDGRDIRGELLKRSDPGPCVTPTGRTYGEDVA